MNGSLMATTSMSSLSMAARVTSRPIRPKPVGQTVLKRGWMRWVKKRFATTLTVDANLDLFLVTRRSGRRWLVDSNGLDAAVCPDVQQPSWGCDFLRPPAIKSSANGSNSADLSQAVNPLWMCEEPSGTCTHSTVLQQRWQQSRLA